MARTLPPLNARQRYGLYQARDYGNFGAVPKTTANSLISRGLVVRVLVVPSGSRCSYWAVQARDDLVKDGLLTNYWLITELGREALRLAGWPAYPGRR